MALLTGRLAAKARAAALANIRAGEASIVIGTHALFQEGVEFASLALASSTSSTASACISACALREKGAHDGHRPHQLIMTATPIPRTLAMTAYADLDVSVIDELPPGRTPVPPWRWPKRGATKWWCASAPPALQEGKPTGCAR